MKYKRISLKDCVDKINEFTDINATDQDNKFIKGIKSYARTLLTWNSNSYVFLEENKFIGIITISKRKPNIVTIEEFYTCVNQRGNKIYLNWINHLLNSDEFEYMKFIQNKGSEKTYEKYGFYPVATTKKGEYFSMIKIGESMDFIDEVIEKYASKYPY